MLPQIAVLQSAFVNGLDSLAPNEDKQVSINPLVDFETALTQDYTYDAHTLMYVVATVGDSQVIPSPRINKPCLPEIIKEGCNVFLTFFGIDIDAPDHETLTAESLARLEESVSAALASPAGQAAGLDEFTAYYTTRAGMRFLYVLDDPMPALDAEQYLLGLIQAFKEAGVEINAKECKDWTRLFRLPRARRDFVLLGHRPFDELIIRPDCASYDARTRLRPIRPAVPTIPKQDAIALPLTLDLPEDTVFPDLCEEFDSKGRVVASPLMKEAKRRLKGRMCYGAIFNGDVLAHPGERDSAIQRLVGEACALLVNMPKATPEFVYALFLPSVLLLEPDSDPRHPGWRVIVWRAICKYWPREAGSIIRAAKIEEDTWNSVVEGLRTWDTSPALFSEHAHVVRDHVLRRGILATSRSYFILKTDGRYETTPTERSHIIARIRELGMDRVLQTFSVAGNKGAEDRSIQAMLNANVASGFEIDGVVTEEGDGTVRGKLLRRTLFRRKRDIASQYNENVDAWLRAFSGDQYEHLCNWIGLALAWDEGPICALSIKGPPGCGKKLLVQGLIECVDTETASDAIEFTKYKSGILKSPWLVINEGFPAPSSMPMPPADTFRAFVGGDPIRIEEKYQVPVTVRNPLRVIFTTNNDDVIRTLAGGRDLTPYDRDAIATRLFHIDVPQASAAWLLGVGGLRFTKGWIAGDSGASSAYVVARHFLYLYDHRPKTHEVLEGSRFLMQGRNNARLIKAMTLRSGAAPGVFAVLTRLIELAGKRADTAIIDGTSIYVTENMIEKYEQSEFPGRQTNHHVIKNVLAAMRKPGSEPMQGVRGVGVNRTLAVWHELNGPLILEEAIERGLPCMRLQAILGYRDGAPAPQREGVKA